MEASPLFSCRANGKLLLTGEYLVLDGALALAVPTRFGQTLDIFSAENEDTLQWQSYDHEDQCWFEGWFTRNVFSVRQATDPQTAVRLLQLLNTCRILNPDFLTEKIDLKVVTRLDFPNDWGLGSSSTLIHCLSKWAGIDQFELLKMTFGGSGYDLACANAEGPIVYKIEENKPISEPIEFNPDFKDSLYFVHLGQKQNSREGIKHYRRLGQPGPELIEKVSGLSRSVASAQTLEEFEERLTEHESFLSEILKMPPVKERLFADYWGAVKSLGAWGGDFVMVTSARVEAETVEYFKRKGFKTVLRASEMLLV